MTDHRSSVHLERERRDVLEQLDAIRTELEAARGSGQLAAADNEQAAEDTTIIVEVERLESLEQTAVLRLAEIEAAEQRVTEGSYGTCERCEQAIGAERLDALPSTRYCVSCAAEVQRAAS